MKQKSVVDRLTELLYPPHCVFCGKGMETRYLQICDDCALTLPDAPPERKGQFFSVCISALPYRDEVRSSVLRMKMGAKRSFTTTYGRMIAAQVAQKLEGRFDVITWVPVNGARRYKRGFDQDQLIARTVADALDMPLKRFLRKRRRNRTQSSISTAAERRSNVLNVFRPVHTKELAGRQILLIDDVITTGATLSECSRVLLTAGAAQVVCATFAATKQKQ